VTFAPAQVAKVTPTSDAPEAAKATASAAGSSDAAATSEVKAATEALNPKMADEAPLAKATVAMTEAAPARGPLTFHQQKEVLDKMAAIINDNERVTKWHNVVVHGYTFTRYTPYTWDAETLKRKQATFLIRHENGAVLKSHRALEEHVTGSKSAPSNFTASTPMPMDESQMIDALTSELVVSDMPELTKSLRAELQRAGKSPGGEHRSLVLKMHAEGLLTKCFFSRLVKKQILATTPGLGAHIKRLLEGHDELDETAHEKRQRCSADHVSPDCNQDQPNSSPPSHAETMAMVFVGSLEHYAAAAADFCATHQVTLLEVAEANAVDQLLNAVQPQNNIHRQLIILRLQGVTQGASSSMAVVAEEVGEDEEISDSVVGMAAEEATSDEEA